MRSLLKRMLPSIGCILLLACNSNTSTTEEKSQAEVTPLVIAAVTGEFIEATDEHEAYTLYKASALSSSDYAKKLTELVFYEESEVEMESETASGDILRKLYPLGWSKEGNFAFAEYSVGYHGDHVVSYSIKNMASGKVVWNKEFIFGMLQDVSEYYSELGAESVVLIKGGESDDELFKYAWTITEKVVIDALKKEDIIFNPESTILKQSNYEGITFAIEKIKSEDDEYEVEYLLKSDQHDSKVIFKDAWEAYQPKVVGVIESPFSKTIAVVCSQKQQVFEMTDGISSSLTGYTLE